ncbi:deoxyribose-phosphate aldolase (plasmid) [Fulvitalea axinellae]|uniref:Deoxyribose-phosphate aldolase n=1 Tax=Fulvitalea axinellae TaxID=1182444 RepID=A0AAU9CL86_9BACT|nr:deoxyribose-phosphate aldolase [Fulvitalea axinellae]
MDIAKYIDHTLLAAVATPADIKKLCAEAKEHGFFSVCVNSGYVSLAKSELKGTDVKVCSVVGFPLGQMAKEAKVAETEIAIAHGADEIDMVINVGALKSGDEALVYEEIKALKEVVGPDRVLKVIIETCYLTDEEKVKACELSVKANADFVKTSTGFGTGGATFEDAKLMFDTVDGKALVKASGGVRDFETADKYIKIGVKRLGTSNGIAIVNGGTGEGY